MAQSGILARLPFPVPTLALILTVAALALVGSLPALKAWVMQVDLRILVGLHLTRFVGYGFLLLYGRGELPWAFAVPGGWGDIAVATGAALLLISFLPAETDLARGLVTLWNALGLVDILFVVGTAMRLMSIDPGSMAALNHLPMSLLPTFLVPLIIVTHVIIFARLRSDAR